MVPNVKDGAAGLVSCLILFLMRLMTVLEALTIVANMM
jgi:hypothetical protein